MSTGLLGISPRVAHSYSQDADRLAGNGMHRNSGFDIYETGRLGNAPPGSHLGAGGGSGKTAGVSGDAEEQAVHLNPFIVLGSAVVGLLVGLTGAGGGALMTPMLILLL